MGVGYVAQPATMTPSLSMQEALTLWLEKYGDTCNEKKLSMTKIFYDTTIPYHQTIIIAIASIYDTFLKSKNCCDI
jgi:hypothetical protein